MPRLAILLACLGAIFTHASSYGQDKQLKDSIRQNIQKSHAIALYENLFSGPNSPVYQGHEYLPYVLTARGNAFFITNTWENGSVLFKGRLYSHLPLLYDILKDQLVLRSWNKAFRILLSQQNVGWFNIGAHHFIRVNDEDSSKQSFPPAGYYEELVQGPVLLLAKRIKTVVIPTYSSIGEFEENDLYYIKKGGNFYRAKSKRSVLKALSDHKTAIKQYLRKNNIIFGSDKEAAMIEMVKYENQLNNKD